MAYLERRRRRLRRGPSAAAEELDELASSAPGADVTDVVGAPTAGSPDERSATTAEVHDPEPAPTGQRRGPGPSPLAEDRDGERGLRGLIGAGASQVSVSAALRARDATRPTDADLAEAEERLVLVRRNWVPREDLPRPGR